MATITGLFEINGVISTDNTVLQNIENICRACGSWMTFDTYSGKWAVVINKPTPSAKSFNDSNIIGGINVSGVGVSEMYNAVSIEFPHQDLRDDTDYVDLRVLDAERYSNEIDNTLNIQLNCLNNPVQAQLLASTELNQSRLDKTIEFRTDYTSIGLRAGDIIDVTMPMYGYDEKLFRIVNLIEEDDGSGLLTISITALEYDISIYDTSDLVRKQRDKINNIVPAAYNAGVLSSKGAATIYSSSTGLTDAANANAKVGFVGALAPAPGAPGGVTSLLAQIRSYSMYYPPNTTNWIWFTSNPINAVYTGTYRIVYDVFWALFDENDEPPLGCYRGVAIAVKLNGEETLLTHGYDASRWDNFTDHHLIGWFDANAGDIITLGFLYNTDYGPGLTQPQVGYTAQPDAKAFITLFGELYYDGVWG